MRKEKFAFILPDTIGEYVAGRQPCDLTTVGPLPLMKKGFGLALPKDSPHLAAFNRALRLLKKNGFLERLKLQWWASECQQSDSSWRLKSHGGNALLRANRPRNIAGKASAILTTMVTPSQLDLLWPLIIVQTIKLIS